MTPYFSVLKNAYKRLKGKLSQLNNISSTQILQPLTLCFSALKKTLMGIGPDTNVGAFLFFATTDAEARFPTIDTVPEAFLTTTDFDTEACFFYYY